MFCHFVLITVKLSHPHFFSVLISLHILIMPLDAELDSTLYQRAQFDPPI